MALKQLGAEVAALSSVVQLDFIKRPSRRSACAFTALDLGSIQAASLRHARTQLIALFGQIACNISCEGHDTVAFSGLSLQRKL